MKNILTVVKIGGKVLDEPRFLEPVLEAFAGLEGQKVLVHGGGKAGSDVAGKLGIEAPLVDGRRITSSEMLRVALMVYGGWMNRSLVARLQALGLNALGLTGADLDVIRAKKRPAQPIDYGWVGDVEQVDGNRLANLLDQDIVPVMAPLTHDGQGQMLNTNADTIASEVARSLVPRFEVRLVYAFERPGVLRDAKDDHSLISHLDQAAAKRFQEEGVIAAGMIPKLKNAFDALAQGVNSVVIGRPIEGNFKGTQLSL